MEENKLDEPGEANWKTMKFREKCCHVYKNITVEPLLVLFIMPSVLSAIAVQNLFLEKACRVNLGYSNETCTSLARRNLSGYEREEKEVQQLVAGMLMWKSLLQCIIPTVLIVFMGAWSDRTRLRKPCILLPMCGEFMTTFIHILNTYFFYELPMEVLGFLDGIMSTILGGWGTMFMAVFSYIADITSVERRTVRVGIVNVTIYLSVPIGMALSGILYIKLGFYGVFSVTSTLYFTGILYGLFFLKENPAVVVQPKGEKRNFCKSVVNFFSFRHFIESFRVTFKKTNNKRRQKLLVLIIVNMVLLGPMHGEMTVLYLFVRYRFGWDEMKYSFFSTYCMITNLIGVSLCIGVFSQIYKFNDAIIGIMSSLSKFIGSFIFAFASTDLMIYMAPLAEFIQGASSIAMRAIISKTVPSDELGQVNSIYGVCEALTPVLYGPMYSAFYKITMDTFPGAFFLLGGFLTIPAILGFVYLYKEREIADNDKSNKIEMTDQNDTSDKTVHGTEKVEQNNSSSIAVTKATIES